MTDSSEDAVTNVKASNNELEPAILLLARLERASDVGVGSMVANS